MNPKIFSIIAILLFSTVLESQPDPKKQVPPDTFRGEFTLTIPADRLLGNISLKVSVEESRDLVETEAQRTENPSEVVFVGHRRDVSVRKDRRGRIRLRQGKPKEGVLIMYPLAPVFEIKTITFRPRFYTREEVFHDKGTTDPDFALDILEIDKIGELEGTVVKSLEGLSFKIGEDNLMEIHHRLSEGKRAAIRLRSSTEKISYLHVPMNNLGTYPAFYVENGKRSRKIFNPPISISFILSSETKGIQRQIPMRYLTRDVNRYLQSHPSHGMQGIIEVPVRLEMELAPEKSAEKREPEPRGPEGATGSEKKGLSDNPFFDF